MGSNINLNCKEQNELIKEKNPFFWKNKRTNKQTNKQTNKHKLFLRGFIYRPVDISEANDPVSLWIPVLWLPPLYLSLCWILCLASLLSSPNKLVNWDFCWQLLCTGRCHKEGFFKGRKGNLIVWIENCEQEVVLWTCWIRVKNGAMFLFLSTRTTQKCKFARYFVVESRQSMKSSCL